MGTRLIQQRRGKGSPTYAAPSHRYAGEIFYPSKGSARGEIMDIINSVGHSAPLMFIQFDNGEYGFTPAPLGVKVGDEITTNRQAVGSILKLANIDVGTEIFNIEQRPFANGGLVRSAGSAARIVNKTDKEVIVELPSRKTIILNPNCRAMIGRIAGGGHRDKPLLKAGKRHHKMHAINKLYPNVHGKAMNAKHHPFGGTHRRHVGVSKSTSRNAPPGRKVGSIASKKTGRTKK